MKKIITSLLLSFPAMMCFAQNDTLLIENFNADPTGNANFQYQVQPPGFTNDPNWYDWDQDGLPDASPQGNRPGEWFWQSGGFAVVDSSDGCMASNSWTSQPSTPVENYLILPAIQIIDGNASLHWKSASFQTPRYLDGYRVLISTSNNDLGAFSDTVFRAAEMTTWINFPNPAPDTNSFSSYSFGPPGAWIQGQDGTFIEYDGDSSRFRGVQKDTSISLAAYSGHTIYIAFEHFTYDDNLLSLDDIMVKGTNPNGVAEISHDPMELYAFPNPANRNTVLNFTLSKASRTTVKITDMLGKEILTRQVAGMSGKNLVPINVEGFSGGTYFYTVTAGTATSTGKFVVVK